MLLNKSMTLHAHRVSHVVFKEGGPDILFGVRNRAIALSNKNVLLVNAWEPHFYEHQPNPQPTILLALYLEPSWLRNLGGRLAYSLHPRFFTESSLPLRHRLSSLHDQLLDILTDRESRSLEALEGLIADTIVELAGPTPRRDPLSAAALVGGIAYDGRIRLAIDAMRSLSGIALDFDDLAYKVGLSRPHFFNLFRKQTGITPATFGSMLRMERSIEYVSDPQMPIRDIAADLGFDSPGNFTRFFVHQQGVTPSQYRRSVQFLTGPHLPFDPVTR
ncbi:helix-turn-helix domain-containing protein [Burkholderia sp. WAC0059]|uniref:helix-turn-helix domain-containing protein n=1 Tax=Burkholderia sp. WAC0059 TaxID=2066022 RepID=UPI0015E11349|nr:AraC family transcriptional regulator [Burkholderia sp. WAC0059]